MLNSWSSERPEPCDVAQGSDRGRGHNRKTVKIQEVSPDSGMTQFHKANNRQTFKFCSNHSADFSDLTLTIY